MLFLRFGLVEMLRAVFLNKLIKTELQGWRPLQTIENVLELSWKCIGNVCSQAEMSEGSLSVEVWPDWCGDRMSVHMS